MQEQLPATLLVLVPLLPLAGAILTVLLGRRLGPRAHLPAMAGIGAAALVAIALLGATARDVGGAHGPVEVISPLWQWASIEGAATDAATGDTAATRGLSIPVTLRLDPLTATMLTIITCVGLLVAIYSTGYMHDDKSFGRFFAYLNLFLFFMLLLVLGRSMLVLFVGWEGVGLA